MAVGIGVLMIAGILAGFKMEAGEGQKELRSFTIPESLMGGMTADEIQEDFQDPKTRIRLLEGEVPIRAIFTDVRANGDGTLTYVFTEPQLQVYKKFVYDAASLRVPMKLGFTDSIKRTKFTKDDLTEMVVYVDKNLYENSEADGIYVNFYGVTYMGLHQILNGTDLHKWNVHIIVKDKKTGQVIEEESYPKEAL